MAKTLTILSEDPLLVSLRKNKRAISETSALAALARRFPEIPADQWVIHRHSSAHSTLASLKICPRDLDAPEGSG